ncbi:MAG: DUF1566 domain-containing protein, partial [Patescibacteria group bacterium]|nr:DUF1566 domain-containing protein [Patescibacteria group bacterium]
MNAFRTDLANLVARHIIASPAERLLSVVDILNEPHIHFECADVATRFTRLGSDGEPTTDAAQHSAVHDAETGLTWAAEPLPGEFNWEGAKNACAALSLLGKSDWRLPTIKELLSIV